MRLSIYALLLTLSGFYSCQTSSQVNDHKTPNKLIHESSPYLLQHAYNPVDWHPWNDETLKKAEEEGKMLIISIGYAACHWCHVMEHESFEDSTVAAVMNEHFIPIKVDREERPDVDDIYMSAAQLITGSGGWPLNAFALADGRPVWAGTYFPKERWMDILRRFATLQEDDPERLEKSAAQLVEGIHSLDQIVQVNVQDFTPEDIHPMADSMIKRIDLIDGGRRGAPKFPMPNNLDFLLKYGTQYNNDSALEALKISLDKMALGGIYDQIGGGFARYSVDAKWLVPHFEKMLYDNGQLVSLYSDAYRWSSDPLYKHVVEQSLDFVERELMDDRSRFYSSLDADSEGEEGKFYIWTEAEIDIIVADPTTNEIVKDYYNITPEGNWEHGHNILHITATKEEIANKHPITVSQLDELVSFVNEQLLEARGHRVRPGLDDKVLTSWNALMIKGYVDAFKALDKKEYLDRAMTAMAHLLSDQMQSDGRLDRNYKNGKASINAFLDDYALTIQAVLALYEVTFDEEWLSIAQKLTDYTVQHFYNQESRMFYYTSDIDPALIARKTETSDNVIPASNSVMARNLRLLGELLYPSEYTDMSKQMLANIKSQIEKVRQPGFYSNWLQLLEDEIHPPYEVAILGPDATSISQVMMKTYRPNAHFMGSTKDSDLPLLKHKFVDGETMIYVCQKKTCKMPVGEVYKAEELLQDPHVEGNKSPR